MVGILGDIRETSLRLYINKKGYFWNERRGLLCQGHITLAVHLVRNKILFKGTAQ